MAIYVEFERPKTIKEFLIKFYSNVSYGTAQAATTYKDILLTQIQCNKSYRSFDDLLELIQTYYPETTPKILIYELLTIKIKNPKTNENFKPHLGVCSGMRRIRYIPYPGFNPNFQDYIDIKMYDSQYTWKELLLLLDIKNEIELKSFVENN